MRQRSYQESFKKPLESITKVKGLIVGIIQLDEKSIVGRSIKPIKQFHELDD
ncbi:hypothetical protein J7K07_03830 [Candidatus Bathyarchaeota archaeon]|nr:hypothetical protein [Candidatus Bathyarchaeota archaeon]